MPNADFSDTLGGKFRRPQLDGADASGPQRVSATVMYGDNLFLSDFLIQSTGMIEMLEDDPLATNFGSRIQAPLVIDNPKEQPGVSSKKAPAPNGSATEEDAPATEPPIAKPSDMPMKPTHAALAAKLLRDAATFFRTIGEQNEPLREQMTENSSVFLQVADLVEADPLGVVEDPDAAPGD